MRPVLIKLTDYLGGRDENKTEGEEGGGGYIPV